MDRCTALPTRAYAFVRQRLPVVVAAGGERRLELRALQDDAGLGLGGGERDRFIEQRLIGDDAAGLDAAARRQDQLGPRVVDARRQLLGGESAEHHRVDRADARAGQHGDHRLGHHRHVDDDAVALGDAELAQHAREGRHLDQQLAVADLALHAGDRRIVDDRGPVGVAALDVAVDRVPAGVADAVGEPAAVDAGRRIEDGLRRLDPVDRTGGLAPEADRVLQRAPIDLVIAARARVHGVLPIGQRLCGSCHALQAGTSSRQPRSCAAPLPSAPCRQSASEVSTALALLLPRLLGRRPGRRASHESRKLAARPSYPDPLPASGERGR